MEFCAHKVACCGKVLTSACISSSSTSITPSGASISPTQSIAVCTASGSTESSICAGMAGSSSAASSGKSNAGCSKAGAGISSKDCATGALASGLAEITGSTLAAWKLAGSALAEDGLAEAGAAGSAGCLFKFKPFLSKLAAVAALIFALADSPTVKSGSTLADWRTRGSDIQPSTSSETTCLSVLAFLSGSFFRLSALAASLVFAAAASLSSTSPRVWLKRYSTSLRYFFSCHQLKTTTARTMLTPSNTNIIHKSDM